MASSADDIANLLAEEFAQQVEAGEFDSQLDEFMADEVVPVWQGNYPVDTGAGRDSVQVTKQASGGKGQVGATDEAASFIEYGTEDTPERAVRARTIEHFNGPASATIT